MSDINSNAAAARESARQGDGRFGAQENAEAATIDLTAPIATYRIVADTHSGHGLPDGAEVTFFEHRDGVDWYTQGGDGDEVAIDPRDLVEVDEPEPQECVLCEKEATVDQNGRCTICSEHEAGAHDDNEFRMQNYCSLCSEVVEGIVDSYRDAAEG